MPGERPPNEEIERVIQHEITDRVERRYRSRPAVTATQTLEGLGLDSLDLHELVESLETRLGKNPFEDTYSINDLRTVGDLYGAYNAVFRDDAPASSESDDMLLAARRRAAARRRSTP
jgi:acyl carrier protein